ncbi:MAG: hypothetical protein WC980_04745 [Candidatus Brocadiia bacterium]
MVHSYGHIIEVEEGSVAAHLLDGKLDIGKWLETTVLKMAPIWMASIAFHIFILLILAAIPTSGKVVIPDSITEIDLTKPIPPPPDVLEEVFEKPVITKEKPVEKTVENPNENDEVNENPDDIQTKSPLDAKGVYDSIGIGPGLGGHRPGGGISGIPGVTTSTTVSTLAGLLWLARHQNPDGSWGAQKFLNQCKGARCGGPGEEEFDVGLTGLALLAFTGAGYTPSSKDTYGNICFGTTVKKAANFLAGIQDSQGIYGSVKQGKFLYNQAIASYAMADLYGLIKDVPAGLAYKDTAQKGIDFLLSARNPGRAWRYQPRDGNNDTSVSGWAAMAIKSAQGSDLTVDPAVFTNVRDFFDQTTNQTDGVVGYTELGSVAVRPSEKDPKIQPSMTAIGIMVRIFIDKNANDPVIKKGVDRILQDLPNWNPSRLGEIDYYYWFYASYCLNQFDGPNGPCWKKWNEKMKDAVIKNQRPESDGCLNGSWDPIDRWSDEGSRVYSTAINVLTLEVYYRLAIVRPGSGSGH